MSPEPSVAALVAGGFRVSQNAPSWAPRGVRTPVGRNLPRPRRGGSGVAVGDVPLLDSPPAGEPATVAPIAGPTARFRALAQRWKEETEFESAAERIFLHPAYQEIIGMGPAVLPALLRDLAETRSHWFWALRAISGENPVAAADRGNLERMTHAWLAWGEARGHL